MYGSPYSRWIPHGAANARHQIRHRHAYPHCGRLSSALENNSARSCLRPQGAESGCAAIVGKQRRHRNFSSEPKRRAVQYTASPRRPPIKTRTGVPTKHRSPYFLPDAAGQHHENSCGDRLINLICSPTFNNIASRHNTCALKIL